MSNVFSEKPIRYAWLKVLLIIIFLALIGFSFLPYVGTSVKEWTFWQLGVDTHLPEELSGQTTWFFWVPIVSKFFILCGLIGILITNSWILADLLMIGVIFTLMFTGGNVLMLKTDLIKNISIEHQYYPGSPTGIVDFNVTTYYVKIGLWLSLGAAALLVILVIINGVISKIESRKNSIKNENQHRHKNPVRYL